MKVFKCAKLRLFCYGGICDTMEPHNVEIVTLYLNICARFKLNHIHLKNETADIGRCDNGIDVTIRLSLLSNHTK
jgi:hypothetical protein